MGKTQLLYVYHDWIGGGGCFMTPKLRGNSGEDSSVKGFFQL